MSVLAPIFFGLILQQPVQQQQQPTLPPPSTEDRLQLELSLCTSTANALKNATLQLQSENRHLMAEVEELKKKCGAACIEKAPDKPKP